MFANASLARRIERAEMGLIVEAARASATRLPPGQMMAAEFAGAAAVYVEPGAPFNKVAGIGGLPCSVACRLLLGAATSRFAAAKNRSPQRHGGTEKSMWAWGNYAGGATGPRRSQDGRRIITEGATMTLCKLATVTLLLLPLTLAADQGATPSAIGDWKAVFVGPIGPRPKMVDAIHFSIRDTPLGPVATAKAANWPGMLDVTDLKIDGDRVSFTGTGRAGWSVRPAGGPTEHFCCPKLLFAGTVRGDEMTLTLTWQRSDLPDDPRKQPLPMEAARVR